MGLLGDIVGTVIPGVAAAVGAKEQRKWEAGQAQKQMDFQERMSSTSWQRAVQDMKLAGINPMLSYMQGGASSPSGAMASGQDVIGPAVSSAQHGRALMQELALMRKQVENVKADTEKKNAERRWTDMRTLIEGWAPGNAGAPQISGVPQVPFGVLKREQQIELQKMQEDYYRKLTRMLELGMPAAQVQGSSLAGWAKLLFSGMGAVGGLMSPLKWIRGKGTFSPVNINLPRSVK